MATLAGVLPSVEAEGNPIRDAWDRLSRIPGGRAVFHGLIRLMVPYTGSLGSRVVKLERGFCAVELQERWAVRNHLRSVHAIALANLAEFCGNLGVAYSLPDDARFIVAGMRMTYHKKSRGLITATSHSPIIEDNTERDIEVVVEMRNEAGELCATGVLETKIGPKKR